MSTEIYCVNIKKENPFTVPNIDDKFKLVLNNAVRNKKEKIRICFLGFDNYQNSSYYLL